MCKTRFVSLCFIWMVSMSVPISQAQSLETDAVDPVAQELLQGMSDYLGSLQRFSFHTENSTESLLVTGEKLQRQRAVDLFVRRPDRFRGNVDGDLVSQELYYDGHTITLFGKRVNYYAALKAPPTIEAAMDHALESFNLDIPLGDLIHQDSYNILTHRIQSGYYVGPSTIHGVACHQLFFRGDETDVQVWIEKGKRPVPRKLVITSKWVTGAPQFVAVITRWDVAPNLDDDLFTFVPPEDAIKIDFLPSE